MANFNNIVTTKAPNLPISASQYSQQYEDQFSNVLRLYFNQLDSVNAQNVTAINNLNVNTWMSLGTGIW